eukprot:754888-Hanusia_phi.AAC.1
MQVKCSIALVLFLFIVPARLETWKNLAGGGGGGGGEGDPLLNQPSETRVEMLVLSAFVGI